MISYYKLKQIIKIWMESIKTDREVWYETVGGGTDKGYFQTYELSPPTEVRTSDDNVELPAKRDRKYEWYPLPSDALLVNPGLVQNPGY